jgi:hypothetical protein
MAVSLLGLIFSDREDTSTERFFDQPKSERAAQFLSRILQH